MNKGVGEAIKKLNSEIVKKIRVSRCGKLAKVASNYVIICEFTGVAGIYGRSQCQIGPQNLRF